MNALLIHNDNLPTSLINSFENHLKFDIGQAKILEFDFSFDKEVNRQLDSAFENKSYDVIYIPYSLSLNNYLELSGLRLALHIRLTESWGHKLVPIVFIGHETKEQIAKLTDYGGFLFSSGTFSTTKFDYVQLREQYNWIQNNWKRDKEPILSISEYNTMLSRIKVMPSASHQSHHSLVNEWAMYRWAKALGDLGVESQELALNDDNVSTDLYFKYLIAINNISPLINGDIPKVNIQNSGKVLLIDDESNKGWYEIFCSLLYDRFPDLIEFDYVDDHLFRHKSQKEIIEISKKHIIETEELPDVVILDLRIHSSDYGATSIKEITGFKILEEIKRINPGIQVIIFSATNKVWNLQALQVAGADGFIHKESFENSRLNSEFTFQSIENMLKQVEESLSVNFLKDISSHLEPLLRKVETNSNKKPKNYKLTIPQGKLIGYRDYLTSANFLLYSNPKDLKYCFLQLILVIEDIVKSIYIDSIDGHVVQWSLNEPVVCLEKNDFYTKLKLKPRQKWNTFSEGDYILEGDFEKKLFNDQVDRIPFNYRLNCVLYFKHNVQLEQSAKYSKLYRLRSSSVAHIGISVVQVKDVIDAIELLKILTV